MLLASGDWGETMAETIAGGYYIGEDGRPHDAWGRPLPDLSVAPEDQAIAVARPADEPNAPAPPAKAAKPKRGQ